MANEEMLEQTESMADYEAHFDDANPWNLVTKYMEEGTNLHLTIEGIVNGGAIAHVEGLRGFIPASRLSLSYVENLESYLLQEMDLRVIDVDQAKGRLILSAREILKEQQKKAKDDLIASVKVGSVLKGKVESLQNYGAFVKLENGLSGLVHISQISTQRIKSADQALTKDQEVDVKVIGVKDGKISLSIKALMEEAEKAQAEAEAAEYELPESEAIGTSLAGLLKGLKL